MGAADDIGELARLRSELELLRERFDLLVEHSAEAIFVKDVDSRYVYVNEAGAQMMFRRPEELIGQTDVGVFPPDVVEEIRADDLHVMTTGQAARIRTARVLSNGARVEFQTIKRPWRDVEGRIVGIVGTTRNITEVVEAQLEAAAAAKSYRTLVEAVPELVIVHRDGCVVYANPGALAVLGRTEPEVLGLAIADLVRPQDRGTIGQSGALAVEVGFVRPDDRVRVVEVTEVGATWCGQPARFTIGRDVSLKRRMQAQLRDADRLASVGMLAGSVAHEVKNPLTFVLETVRKLQDEAPPAARSQLADVEDAAERIAAIVQGISGLARPDPPGLGAVDLEVAIDRALLLAGPRLRDCAEVVRVRSELPPVRGAERRLVQVLVNLLVNAAQALGVRSDLGRVEVTTRRVGEQVELRVRDNGPGVDPALARRLFEPFETSKPSADGTGLGLWISAGIVRDFGGALTLENPGEPGACFRVTLRVETEAALRPPAPEPLAGPRPVAPPAERPRLLIVDDESLISDLLSDGLTRTFAVEVRSTVEGAIRRLENGPPLDLVLCDLIMPGGGGPRVFAALEEMPEPRPPLVFMSGGAANPEVRAFLERRHLSPIEKPFRIAEVRRRLLEALVAQRVSRAGGR